MPKEENIALLKQLAWVNTVLGSIDEAKASIRELLRYKRDAETLAFKHDLDRRFPNVTPISAPGLRLGFVVIVGAILLMYGLIGNAILGTSPETSTAPSAPTITAPSSAPTITTSQSYSSKLDSWITKYGQIRGSYLDNTNTFITYDQAVANSSLFIRESNLFINSAEILLKETETTTNIPDRYASLHSSLRGFIALEIQFANLSKQAVQYQSVPKWNDAINLQGSVSTAQQNFVNQAKASGLYK